MPETTANKLFESMRGALVVTGADGNIASVNTEAERLLKTAASKLKAQPLQDLFEETLDFASGSIASDCYQNESNPHQPDALMCTLRPEFGGRFVVLSKLQIEGSRQPMYALHDITAAGQSCRLDVIFGEAYRQIAEGEKQAVVLGDLCAGLADALRLPFIWIERQLASGVMVPLATSSAGPLRKELYRLPEHDDDSVIGDGPSVRVLRSHQPVLIDINDEGFLPWKKAAAKQQVVSILALPMDITLHGKQQVWVLLFAAAHDAALTERRNADFLAQLTKRISGVCQCLSVQQQQRIVFDAMHAAGNAAFITDIDAKIVWSNPAFGKLSGYDHHSVVGQNPSILKSGKQGFRYYDRLWRTISAGKVWSGETIDRDKNGELYTIRQTVSPVKRDQKITHYISIHEDISSKKAMQAARERARRVDELTGLMTTAMFEQAYERAVDMANRNDESLALLLITINEFHSLMSSLGQDIEELVLETLGDRIRGSMEEDDFAAHMGDGDFAVLLNSVGSREEANAIAEKILDVLDEPFPLLGDKLYLTRGVGIAFMPEDGQEADMLMRVADARAGGQN